MLTKGSVLNDTYQILGEIGAGGGGVVYYAKHLRLQTDVVVKRIKDEVRGKIHSRQEADVLKKLKHPYLPRVYDFIETNEGVYTVMDYIPGQSLDKVLRERKRFSQKQVLKWAEQLGEALAYLHNQNPAIIHSDIKPANIILTPEGNICLIDFNVSIVLDAAMKSNVGISAGYSSPEQYGDVRLYQQFLMQTGMKNAAAAKASQDDRTELLQNDRTEILQEDKTELLQEDKTELLYNNQTGLAKGNDSTLVLGLDGQAVQNVAGNATLPLFEENVQKVAVNPGSQEISYSVNSGSLDKYIGAGRGIDVRSDIYSLGCVLYHLLAGFPPSINFEQIVPLAETNANVSEGLSVIIEKMMQFDPKDRYQNGSEFLQAVRNCYKLDKRYISLHRRQNMLLGLASVLVIAGAGLIGLGARQMKIENERAYEQRVLYANELADSGDYEEAIIQAVNIQKDRSSWGKGYERELYYTYSAGRYEKCVQRGNEILALQLVSADSDQQLVGDIYFVLANSYYELGEFEDALVQMQEALSYNTSNSMYYRDYAVILAKLGYLEDAQDAIEKAEDIGLGEESLYFAKAELYAAQGEADKAVEAFKQTIAATEDKILKKRAVMLCAEVLRDKQRLDEEIELLETALNQADNQEKMVMTEYLADAYARMAEQSADEAVKKEYKGKALQLFEQLKYDGYVTYQLQENIAILREAIGDFDGASEQLLQMAEDYPEDYRVYKRLAFLETDKQQYLENADRSYTLMKEYYDKAVELYQNSKTEDVEMQMLEALMQDIIAGGWLM